MKKKLFVTVATAAFAGICAFSPLGAKFAAADTLENPEELRYSDPISTYSTWTEENVYYTTKDEDTPTTTVNMVPFYYINSSSMPNSCGPVAGSIITAFYDKYYENLIPNYTAYYASGLYRYMNDDVVPTMEELYVLMRTNVDDVGVSQADCKSGLQTYFSNKGLSLSYSSIESNGSFNFNLYKQAIAANKPVIMFCTNFELTSVGYCSGYDLVSTKTLSGAHIVVGYGYYSVDYYNANNVLTRTDTYLLVSSGRSELLNSAISIASTSWLVDGYAVSVS